MRRRWSDCSHLWLRWLRTIDINHFDTIWSYVPPHMFAQIGRRCSPWLFLESFEIGSHLRPIHSNFARRREFHEAWRHRSPKCHWRRRGVENGGCAEQTKLIFGPKHRDECISGTSKPRDKNRAHPSCFNFARWSGFRVKFSTCCRRSIALVDSRYTCV